MDVAEDSKVKQKSLYRRILDGEYSLARTFWLYAIGSNILVQFIYKAAFQTPLVESVLMVFICSLLVEWWRYITLVATWRSCANSTINKWFIYAVKSLVIFWVIMLVIDFLYLLKLVPYL